MGIKMFKLILIFATVIFGNLALPLDETDLAKYFSNQDARIVNGVDAPEGSIPYMAALVHGLLIGSFQCGGSVITTRHILSAAHCFERLYQDGQLTPTLRVIVGTNYWNLGGQTYSIQRNITHPKHIYIRDPLNVTYDIGLLITNSEIVLTERVQLVPLNLEHVGAGVAAKVAGWGRLYHQGPVSPNLQELTVTTLDDERCDRELRQASINSGMALPDYKPETEFCTLHSFGHGVCNGDSGSALVTASGHQIGIVSWGLPCARGAPDVFVRISGFKDWLRDNLVI